MHYVHTIAILALLQFIFFGVQVGRARAMYGVKAPATSGHPQFERVFRVHMNTLEQMVCFLPGLYIASQFWPPVYVAAVGAVYLVGRFVYARSYVADPMSRGVGFLLTVAPTFALLVAGLVGVAMRVAS